MLCVKKNAPSRASHLNFANLPTEIRFCIFDKLISLPQRVEWAPHRGYNRKYQANQTNIMQISKQFCEEFAHLLYSSRIFSFYQCYFMTCLFEESPSVGRYLSNVEISNFNDNYEDLWRGLEELGSNPERLNSVTVYHDDVCPGAYLEHDDEEPNDTWIETLCVVFDSFLRLVRKQATRGKGAQEAVEVLRVKAGNSPHYGGTGVVARCRLDQGASICGKSQHIARVEGRLRAEIVRLYELWKVGGLGAKMNPFNSIEYHKILTREIAAGANSRDTAVRARASVMASIS